MFNGRSTSEPKMTTGRFIAVAKPSPAEGVGRAVQIAYRDGFERPPEFRVYLDRLSRFGF